MIHSFFLLIPFLAYAFLITSSIGYMPSFSRLSAVYSHPANYLSPLMRCRLLHLISMANLNLFQTSSFTLSTTPLLRFGRHFVPTLSRVSNHPSLSSADPQLPPATSSHTSPLCCSPPSLPGSALSPSSAMAARLGARSCSRPEGASSRDFSMMFWSHIQWQLSVALPAVPALPPGALFWAASH